MIIESTKVFQSGIQLLQQNGSIRDRHETKKVYKKETSLHLLLMNAWPDHQRKTFGNSGRMQESHAQAFVYLFHHIAAERMCYLITLQMI